MKSKSCYRFSIINVNEKMFTFKNLEKKLSSFVEEKLESGLVRKIDISDEFVKINWVPQCIENLFTHNVGTSTQCYEFYNYLQWITWITMLGIANSLYHSVFLTGRVIAVIQLLRAEVMSAGTQTEHWPRRTLCQIFLWLLRLPELKPTIQLGSAFYATIT